MDPKASVLSLRLRELLSVDFCDVLCKLRSDHLSINAMAGWTVRTELELAADEDIFAAKNLNLFSAGDTVLGVNAFAALAMVTLVDGGVMLNSIERGINYPE